MKQSMIINGTKHEIDVDPEMPLLWFLRDRLAFTGTKFGCGSGLCGACTVHIDGTATRSCITYLADVEGLSVTTIEGLESEVAKEVQSAWNELEVPQCGYCQSGQVMAATALLKENGSPTDEDIDKAMSGNICRCATYPRIRQAIKNAAQKIS